MKQLVKGLYVSCQPATGDEDFYDFEFIKRFALSAEYGNAKAVRIEGVGNVERVKKYINIPIIALIKKTKKNILNKRNITPTFGDISKLYNVGARIISVDFTLRENCNEYYYKTLMNKIKNNMANIEIIADVSTVGEAIIAEKSGVDYVSSTLTGYTDITKDILIPNFDILNEFQKRISIPYIAEGGFESNDQVLKAKRSSVYGVTIGTAITRPHIITAKFSKLLE